MKSQIRKVVRTVLSCMLLLVMFAGDALAMSVACYINADTKVYSKPSSSAASMKAPKGLKVTMRDYEGSWALVSYKGKNAYIPIKRLTLKKRITAYVTKSSTPLYKSASSSASKRGNLEYRTAVYVIGRDGDYFRVQNKSASITGYVKVSHVSTTKPKAIVKESKSSSSSSASKPSASPSVSIPSALNSSVKKYSSSLSKSQKIEYVIYVASKNYGKPYSTSANPPKSFDCARFTYYCYNQVGVRLESNAEAQGYDSSYEKITSIADLKRGDVVCFNTNTSDDDLSDHTGIYLGNGYFVHASSAAGKVIVSTLSSGYYKRTFSWARRIL